MSLEKVDGFASLRKDTANGGVVNVDKKTYEGYRVQRMIALQKHEESKHNSESITNLQTQLNTLKSDINDIKSLLINLLEKGK
jgi:hypothetical protein